jgi:hypothetical protein
MEHWIKALRRDAPSARYTLPGYLIHHASATFWAVLFERGLAAGALLSRRAEPDAA